MIALEELSVRLGGRWVLDRLSLQVAPGETVVITGANGSGKSVLARSAAGLLAPSGGRVTLDGAPVTGRLARRSLGYLPQSGGVYGYLTVAENLSFHAAAAGVPRPSRARMGRDLLELVGLAGVGGVEAERLTQGQRRRLAVARALMGEPKALVLDEPLAGLDADGRADLRHLLAELAGMGRALLIAAGDPDGIGCGRLLTLRDGRLTGGAAT